MMIQQLSLSLNRPLGACEHRTVSKDGRIVCARIVQGENNVSPDLCRSCPFKAVNCRHLRFALRHILPRPLLVRFNGRTEIWDDQPPELRFERAACAARIIPVDHPRACAACSLRLPLQAPAEEQPAPSQRRAAAAKVVPFPCRDPNPASALTG